MFEAAPSFVCFHCGFFFKMLFSRKRRQSEEATFQPAAGMSGALLVLTSNGWEIEAGGLPDPPAPAGQWECRASLSISPGRG